MIARTIDGLSDDMRRRERAAYDRFENALSNMYLRIAIASVLALVHRGADRARDRAQHRRSAARR